MLNKTTFLAFKLSENVFVMLINVKMPTIVGILTFMSMLILCPVETGLYLSLRLVGLQFVIVVFPDHTHLLF